MKLILAIVNKDDANMVSGALLEQGFFATKLATTGGFLKVGNTTFLIGVDERDVDRALECIKLHASKRTQAVPEISSYSAMEMMPTTIQVTVGGATIFVLDVDRFEKF